jgi:SagB-type dehydrogenase family enzyme
MAQKSVYDLPKAGPETENCLTRVLQQRRTHRAFASRPLSLSEVAQLLWATQGISSPEGLRTAPSAGALYPLELHLLVGDVDGLPAGRFRYDPEHQSLRAETRGDLRQIVATAALRQGWIATAPAVFVISAVDTRTTRKYGRRGVRYVHMEAGHAAQNLLLQAAALRLAAAIVGAFDDEELQRLLDLPGQERPLLILPVGHLN